MNQENLGKLLFRCIYGIRDGRSRVPWMEYSGSSLNKAWIESRAPDVR